RRMTEYLLSMGHRRLAYVGDDPTLVHGQQRYRGFLGSLLEHGHELPMEWVFAGRLTDGTAGARFAGVFGEAARPTAVVCGADERAAEALALLGRMGIACPDEVAVVGIGDAPYAGLLSTPLTSYRFDLRLLAAASAAAVRALLAGEAAESVTVGGEVVRRASCGAAR
ncbi:MAG: LacI family transcriptional regulator, partial [Chloroflexi bacterium]|nr:LacI family transcriptional regulator [Chloroflexota bacterium]